MISRREADLLMSFQLIVGILTVMGTGRASLSRPRTKHGSVSRQHSPSAESEGGGVALLRGRRAVVRE